MTSHCQIGSGWRLLNRLNMLYPNVFFVLIKKLQRGTDSYVGIQMVEHKFSPSGVLQLIEDPCMQSLSNSSFVVYENSLFIIFNKGFKLASGLSFNIQKPSTPLIRVDSTVNWAKQASTVGAFHILSQKTNMPRFLKYDKKW